MSKPNSLFKDAYNRALGMLAEGDTLPSEPGLARALGVSRTTVRAVLAQMETAGLIDRGSGEARGRRVARSPVPEDRFPAEETAALSQVIERAFMRRYLVSGAREGDAINELEIAREVGASTSAVREFLIRFSRFGLIEKRRNSHWVLKGFNRDFALELTEVREMFELRSARAFVKLPREASAWAALASLEEEHRAMLAAIDTRYPEFSELDERFHRLIHEASHNRFIIGFHDVIAMIFHYHYQWNKARKKDRNRVAIEEHLAYIAALQSGEARRVEAACRSHLTSARATLLESIRIDHEAF